ncbi:hypothetical protein [Zhongshania aquimaris]|uniref:Uncharacterized protein n=1 Tax=Zhongshania aquimaris TaxID=2857107 RepID=A0ABS6VTT8_9GAMM|nr:hypothetical protein [Zhongshania aquimaris]MBW2941733.1 hypothetical protein [Zhongshania aquimaris]
MRCTTPLLVMLAVLRVSSNAIFLAEESGARDTQYDCIKAGAPEQSETKITQSIDDATNIETDSAATNKTGKIESIDIIINPIFDESKPQEKNWLFRLANRLHIPTQKKVVRDDILVDVNDPINQTLLDTSERILHTRHYA